MTARHVLGSTRKGPSRRGRKLLTSRLMFHQTPKLHPRWAEGRPSQASQPAAASELQRQAQIYIASPDTSPPKTTFTIQVRMGILFERPLFPTARCRNATQSVNMAPQGPSLTPWFYSAFLLPRSQNWQTRA